MNTRILALPAFAILIMSWATLACQPEQKPIAGNSLPAAVPKQFYLYAPSLNATYRFSDSIPVRVGSQTHLPVDSTQVFLDGQLCYTESKTPGQFQVQGIFNHLGEQNMRLVVYSGSLREDCPVQILLLADKEPRELSYTVLRKFPHDPRDYTQGLLYRNGFLYESTGQFGQSRLAKKNISNGSTLMEHQLDKSLFGEGLTCVGDTLYQITYLQQQGFMYKLSDFSQIGTFSLQTTEGWGLAYDGNQLIQTDGSPKLYYYSPGFYEPGKEVAVADHQQLIRHLNELEYVDGVLWANIYTTNLIVQIDPLTGTVIGRLDLSRIFPENIPDDIDHVLNGIAYNPNSNTFYVTGKLWPVLYEIRIH